jgi:hypothetical protein
MSAKSPKPSTHGGTSKSIRTLLAAWFFGLLSPLCQAESPAKEALLIANGDYTHFGKLPNPLADAKVLSASLRKIGFTVSTLENGSREKMLDALAAFEDRLKGKNAIAFFHYGGHGVQVNGRNYLIPADADIPDERRVSTRAIELDEVMAALISSGAAANIIVLDACRDNPLPATSTRSASRGLFAVQTKPKNSIVIYAAEAGHKADDGLFTPIFANALNTPGRALGEVLTDVRRQVHEKSGGNQTPVEYNQLFEQVVLNTSQPGALAHATPPAPPREEAMLRRREEPQTRFPAPADNTPPPHPSPANGPDTAPVSDALVSEMRAPIDQLFVAWQSLDVRRYMAQWQQDAVKVDLKSGRKYSMDDLYHDRARQFPLYRTVKTDAVIKLRQVDAIRSAAVFDVWYDMVFVRKTGTSFREKAKESYVVERTGDRWLIRLNRDYEKN